MADYNALIEQYKKKLKESGAGTDYSALYETAADALMNAQNASYQSKLATLEEQLPQIKADYDSARTDAYQNARLSAVRTNETLAALGLAGNLQADARSGVSETSRIAADNELRKSINLLNTEQLAQEQQLRQKIADAGYENDEKLSGILADYANQLAEYRAKMQEYELEKQKYEQTLAEFAYQKEQDSLENRQTAIENAMSEVSMFGRIMTQAAADALGLPIGTMSYAVSRKTSRSGRSSSSGSTSASLSKSMKSIYETAQARMQSVQTDTYGAAYNAALYGISVDALPAYRANQYLLGEVKKKRITEKQANQLRELLGING